MKLVRRLKRISLKLAEVCGKYALARCVGDANAYWLLSMMALARDQLFLSHEQRVARGRAARWVTSRVISHWENHYGS